MAKKELICDHYNVCQYPVGCSIPLLSLSFLSFRGWVVKVGGPNLWCHFPFRILAFQKWSSPVSAELLFCELGPSLPLWSWYEGYHASSLILFFMLTLLILESDAEGLARNLTSKFRVINSILAILQKTPLKVVASFSFMSVHVTVNSEFWLWRQTWLLS